MKKFAKVNQGKVVDVLVAEQSFFDDFVDTSPGDWIETTSSDDATQVRKHQAAVGDFYDAEADAFYEPSPYPSQTLNRTTFKWEPPVARPADADATDDTGEPIKKYKWNETDQQWEFQRNYSR